MIRIQTIADFDTNGRFTVTGQTTEAVPPGPHPVVVEFPESTAAPVTSEVESAAEPTLVQVGNLLLISGKILEDPEAVRRRLDEERAHQLLYGHFE